MSVQLWCVYASCIYSTDRSYASRLSFVSEYTYLCFSVHIHIRGRPAYVLSQWEVRMYHRVFSCDLVHANRGTSHRVRRTGAPSTVRTDPVIIGPHPSQHLVVSMLMSPHTPSGALPATSQPSHLWGCCSCGGELQRRRSLLSVPNAQCLPR